MVGKRVLLRVKGGEIRIFLDAEHLVTYSIPADRGNLVQDPAFYAALRADQDQFRRKYARRRGKGRAVAVATSLTLPVEKRPLSYYEGLLASDSLAACPAAGGEL